jgi:hypothetical protein
MSSEALTSPQAAENLADRLITEVGELAEFASDIVADAEKLCDRVAELENDGIEIPAVVDAVDRLHMTAAAAARELAAVVKDFEDWMPLGEITCGPR